MHRPSAKAGKSVALAIREMRESDVPAVVSILRESPEAAMWTESSLVECSAKGEAWVAESEGIVVGMLVARQVADEMEILNLAIRPEYRRRGAALQLVSAALHRAYVAGARRTYLELRASNGGGFAFYKRLGFRVSGQRPKYYSDPVEDAILMVLEKGKEMF
jgi:[ribosomal protein S18]-alanine N-acetyltransferase